MIQIENLSPVAQAILEHLEDVLQDLADELRQTYDEVEIRLTVSAK